MCFAEEIAKPEHSYAILGFCLICVSLTKKMQLLGLCSKPSVNPAQRVATGNEEIPSQSTVLGDAGDGVVGISESA